MSASLSLNTDEILRAVAAVVGISRTPSSWDDTTEEDVRQIIRNGIRQFFHPPIIPGEGTSWQWRFLEKRFVGPAQDSYSTGTITVSGGTATLAGGTWPSWAGDGVLRADGHVMFVESRDSDSELTIENDAREIGAGTDFELHRWRFDLPDDFGDWLSGLVYSDGTSTKMLRNGSEREVRIHYETMWRTGETLMFAIVPPQANTDGSGVGSVGRGHIVFYPTMDSETHITGPYRAVPEDNLDATDLTVGGSVVQVDSVHAQTLLESILAAAEDFYNIKPSVHRDKFLERLATSIKHDRHIRGYVTVGGKEGVDAARLARLNHVPTMAEV